MHLKQLRLKSFGHERYSPLTNACLKKFDQLLVKSRLDNCKLLDRDLPVGENLQDHYGTQALTFTVDQVRLLLLL